MRATRGLLAGALAACGGAAAAQPAQPAQSAQAGARSTRSGVYTAAQAERGASVYAGMCRSCHSPASHTGEAFAKAWEGRSVAELYAFISERMPKNDPGGLAPEQYADVAAYLLRMNGMPAGSAELPPDSAALAPIRVEAGPPAPAARPQVRKDSPRRPPGAAAATRARAGARVAPPL